jgi:flagellar hook assembly protein FlgD
MDKSFKKRCHLRILKKVRTFLLDLLDPTLTLTVPSSFDPNTGNCNINVQVSDDSGYVYLTIKVYNTVNGEKKDLIKTIINDQQINNGTYNYSWDGKDESGKLLPNGKYIITATVTDEALNTVTKSAETILKASIPLSFANVTKFTKSFNPRVETAKIFFNLSQDAEVTFYVYNLAGVKVYERKLGYLLVGNYEIEWDGKNWQGVTLPNGLYLFQLYAKTSQGEVRINRFIAILK